MFEEKLKSSGLTLADARALGISFVQDASTLHHSFDKCPAMVLPYFDTAGAPTAASKNAAQFYRVRFLRENNVNGFAQVAGAKEQRYSQPPGSGLCAYFPRVIDWEALALDYPIIITEGELKAGKACIEGFATIGLGGVDSFRSTKKGVFFLPELDQFLWSQRRVIIIYDDDYLSKPQICAAINALAGELQERGALAFMATLPSVAEGVKTGLDDFLVAHGAGALEDVLESAEPLLLSERLWEMNGELCYVENPGFVVAQQSGQKIPPSSFVQHSRWATASVPERKVRADGEISYTKVPAAPVWLRWPMRRKVARLSYIPGQLQFYNDGKGEVLNQWRGWGCAPVKGDTSPWRELIKFIFTGAEKAEVEWFLDWCAWPLQNPGAKMYSAVIVHGRETGTGKSLIAYTLGRIYGDNFAEIRNRDLEETWWAENRQFVLGDEITSSNKRHDAEAMKAMITQEKVNINIKFIPQFTIPDCINYYLSSNHADALFLEDADRRYFVHEVLGAPLPEQFYAKYDKWMRGAGAGALFHELLQRDLSKFNPKAHAFRTAARERMVLSGKSDLASWCHDLTVQPDALLRTGQIVHRRDLWTSHEMLSMYRAQATGGGEKVTANGMSRALSAAGFRQVAGGKPLSGADGRQSRYFVIRNSGQWARATPKQLSSEIKKQHS